MTSATTAPTTSSATAETTAVTSCDPATLSFTLGFVQGAAGSYVFPFTVTNRGTQSCPIGGYFGVSIYDQQGDVITASAARDSGSQTQPINLSPGQAARVAILISDNPPNGNDQTCPLIGSFHFIPPNSTKIAQVSIAASAAERDCGGVRIEATATS